MAFLVLQCRGHEQWQDLVEQGTCSKLPSLVCDLTQGCLQWQRGRHWPIWPSQNYLNISSSFFKIMVMIAGKPLIHKNQNIQLAFLMGGVPFFIFSSSFMIFLSFCSSGLSVDSSTSTYADTQVIKCRSHDSTNMILMFLQFHNFFFKILTSSLSKYWISSGLRKGRFPEGWSFICFTVRSSACMWKPVMPPIGVGVAESLRAGVRMGT